MEQYAEDNKIVYSYDTNRNYKITIVPDNYSDATIQSLILPDSEREIVIFTTITSLPSTDVVVNVGN